MSIRYRAAATSKSVPNFTITANEKERSLTTAQAFAPFGKVRPQYILRQHMQCLRGRLIGDFAHVWDSKAIVYLRMTRCYYIISAKFRFSVWIISFDPIGVFQSQGNTSSAEWGFLSMTTNNTHLLPFVARTAHPSSWRSLQSLLK